MLIFHKNLLIPCLFFAFSFYTTNGQDSLFISEFMAVNNSSLQDEDGDHPDWIEIHNAGSADLYLNGWSLTDVAENPVKWVFPDFTLTAGEYLVVFASGKDRKAEKNKLHTNFKLSGSGEYLALVKPGGTAVASVFSPAYPPQFQDISYGESESVFVYFSEPTPGSENTGIRFISPPEFSVKHGFFSEAFNLELSSNTAGADIYYTTNADTPDKIKGTKYTGPVTVTTTTVIRAISVVEGSGESYPVTQSYIFPEDVVMQSEDQHGYPATWLSPIHTTDEYFEIPSDYNMREEFLANPEVGKVILESLESLPVVSIVSDIDNFFSKSTHPDSGGIYMYNGEPDGPTRDMKYHLGRGWERPASVEYFNSGVNDGSIDFQANCGIKIHGGATRTREKTHKHSFRLCFKAAYGPSKLEEQVFGEDSPEQYDWLVLRGGFAGAVVQRFGQQIRDPWAKSSMREMGQYAARSKFVHVYINGLYWGMYNLSERMDDNCMRDNLGGNAEDYDILKDYFEVEAGDTVAWTKLVTMAEDNIESPANYQKLLGNNPDGTPNAAYEKMVNPENLIDYIMMNMHAGMRDWDYHNWIAARRKTDSEGFHFLVWDAEGAFQLSNNVTYIISGGEYNRPTGVFSDLMKNELFKNHFISRVNRHFFEGGALTPAPCLARYNRWFAEIDTALISDQARWGGSHDIWNTTYHQFRFSYFPIRTETVFKQFIAAGIYPEIGIPVFNTENDVIPDDFQLMMTSPEGGEIRYTLDGTDPGHFTLSAAPSIKIYDHMPLPLHGDTIIVSARVKKDTLWSSLVTRQFIVGNIHSSITDASSAQHGYIYSYPNPVEDIATIVFYVSEPSDINITIYNMLGVKIATVINEIVETGEHTLSWDAGNMPAGIYICSFENKTNNTSNRITLTKRP
ncbi:MAG: CotH kinase family protein [Bacteroidales bacterium]|nr:CotH kinase family protein [Bacteroidales bacterium]